MSCRDVRTELVTVQPFSCQHRKLHISNRKYEISIVLEIHISRLVAQRCSFELVISFFKLIFGISVRGWANSFWNHAIRISIRHMNFQYNQILIFGKQLVYLILNRPKLTVRYTPDIPGVNGQKII